MRAMTPARSGSLAPETLKIDRPGDAERHDSIIAHLTEEIDALNRIFVERGGWSRAYATLSPHGHVHRHKHCRTLRPKTVLAWLVALADVNSEDVVALAGWRACGACFPTTDMEARRRTTSSIDAFADYMVAHGSGGSRGARE